MLTALNRVLDGKLFVVLSSATPGGKIKPSPSRGAVPPQLAANIQFPFGAPPPVHVLMAACSCVCSHTASARKTRTCRGRPELLAAPPVTTFVIPSPPFSGRWVRRTAPDFFKNQRSKKRRYRSAVMARRKGGHSVSAETKSRCCISASGRGFSHTL